MLKRIFPQSKQFKLDVPPLCLSKSTISAAHLLQQATQTTPDESWEYKTSDKLFT